MTRGLPAPEPLEIASGMISGRRRNDQDPPLSAPPAASNPREVLEKILFSALSEGPCLVSFSGGRDSSAILALATHVARRHGLDDPIPVTQRYPHAGTSEDAWQETTVRHLGLREWQVLQLTTELDALDGLGAEALRRHGAYWPPLAHAILPAAAAASGGVLLTGNGGDEVFSPWEWRRVALVRRGRLRPTRSDLKWAVLSFLPHAVRVPMLRRTEPPLPWLLPEAARTVEKRRASYLTRWSPRWADDLEYLLESRYLELALGILHALANDAGARLVQPFLDPGFVRAMAAFAPREGFPSRTAALEALFRDLLPAEVTSRSTKALFTDVLWGPASRAFAADWDGSGVDESLVSPAELRRVWLSPRPDFRSVTALQGAWLAAQGIRRNSYGAASTAPTG
jgi:asparagine synthetase B (glutamine-hydrolysing)